MSLTYLKLAVATELVTSGELPKADLLELMATKQLKVVNLKGLMLTSAQMDKHLDGTVDGDTLARTATYTPSEQGWRQCW